MKNIIKKKQNGLTLTNEEISYFIKGYTSDQIPDYQVSALLMAIYFMGMTDDELLSLTTAIANSGDTIDLSAISGVKVDKHSTGGVGDKTTLIVAPIVASCGVKVAKMSGRGLGHTGGTIDKLESINGYKTALSKTEFFDIVERVGVSLVGQSGNLTPADKKLYALRDVTGTVNSIPLIASSIMSKKLAAGSDCILIDVKCGSGAFMKTLDDAILLAKKMVAIGELAGKNTVCIVTDMDKPLGRSIGNSLEVIEAVQILNGDGDSSLTKLCIELASDMLYMAGKGTQEQCRSLVQTSIDSRQATAKLVELVCAQGGDGRLIEDTSRFKPAAFSHNINATSSGFIHHIDTEACGVACMELGAGRKIKTDSIDYQAGMVLNKSTGDYVEINSCIATFYANDKSLFKKAEKIFTDAISIKSKPPIKTSLIKARVDKLGVDIFE